MTLLIDAIVFSLQRYGGISEYFHQLLRKLEKEGIPASVLLETPLKQPVGNGPSGLTFIDRRARFLERYRPAVFLPGARYFIRVITAFPENAAHPAS